MTHAKKAAGQEVGDPGMFFIQCRHTPNIIAVLLLMVVLLPALLVNDVGMGDPFFCKYGRSSN